MSYDPIKVQELTRRNDIAKECDVLKEQLEFIQGCIVRGDGTIENVLDALSMVKRIRGLAMQPTDFGDLEMEIPLL